MKKILIFSTAYLPLIGGAEVAVKEITDRLKDYQFDLICARLDSRLKKNEKIGQVNVYRIGWGSRFDKVFLPIFGFLKAIQIYKTLQQAQGITEQTLQQAQGIKSILPERANGVSESKANILLWGLMASWASLAALFFKLFYPKVPFLLTLQEGDSEKYIRTGRFGLINLSWRLLLKKADFVQVISHYLADLARRFGYKGKIEVVPNGVDLENIKYQISNIKNTNQKLKNKLDIKPDEKVIITVSRLVPKNGIGDLIEAINQFSIFNFQFSIKLLILGSGPLERKLKLQVTSYKLQDKVLFLGNISNEEVPKYLAMADVFVRPSLSEGLGNAFLEAIAAGVPIIGTPVGGIPDFLKDGETGLFCQVRNPKSIAEKINILLSDESLRQKLITNGRKLVEEKYDWNLIAQKMEKIFKAMLIY